jgi:hypothetical protein
MLSRFSRAVLVCLRQPLLLFRLIPAVPPQNPIIIFDQAVVTVSGYHPAAAPEKSRTPAATKITLMAHPAPKPAIANHNISTKTVRASSDWVVIGGARFDIVVGGIQLHRQPMIARPVYAVWD